MNSRSLPGQRAARVALSLIVASILTVLLFQILFGQEAELAPANLSGSTKSANLDEALPGSQINYSIIISNSGDMPAFNVTMTDTLATEMSFIPGSLNVTGGGLFGESGGVITWTGGVNNNWQVQVNFSALLTDSATVGSIITNTAIVGYDGSYWELPASTLVVSETESISYMPIVSKGPPVITLGPIARPSSTNGWTLIWATTDIRGTTGYEIQEAVDPSFSNPTTYTAAEFDLSLYRNPAPTYINLFYYRVRAVGTFGESVWSNTQSVITNYRDDFLNPVSGWAMRRQDTDHIENQVRYENGEYVHEMDSSWDYLISSPLVKIPAPPYRIEMRTRHVEPSNLNSYGMIFGGDWDGQSPCPVGNYSTCFNHYYRLNTIWRGDDPSNPVLKVILSRVDSHNPANNHGISVTLIESFDATVVFPPSSHQRWAVEVYPNGVIKLFVNGNFIGQTVDANYINNPYFGSFSSTDEYAGLQVHFDWFEVTGLPVSRRPRSE